jgi:hypothetical protein
MSVMSERPKETTSDDEPTSGRERYRRLPKPIRITDTVESHDPLPAPDPSMGRDPDHEFMLRNAAG